MSDEPISSPRNPRIAAAAALQRRKARRQTGLSLLEGPHLLLAAVAGGAPIESVFALPEDTESASQAAAVGATFTPVTRKVLDRLAPTEHPRGPVAVFRPPRDATVPGSCLALWGIGDPGNAGTMVRIAAAFRLGVLAGPGTVDMWSPKVVRAGAGAHFQTPIQLGAEVGDLRAGGRCVVATVVTGGHKPTEVVVEGACAILIGEEAHGLPDDAVAAADMRLTIPMPGGTESLNAAAAAAILAYEIRNRLDS